MQENNIIETLRNETAKLMADLRAERKEQEESYKRYLVNGCNMLSTPCESVDSLLEPILPRVGLAALVGSSDSGKSTLLRGLAMAVASGAGHYLSFRLSARHHRAIYVATEDDQTALAPLMHRQIRELMLPPEAYSSLDFIFDTENLTETLDLALSNSPADLVIIDAFADLYTGPMNENNRVRSFLNTYSQLAHKHSTLIIFLHHTGKRTESLTPSKHNAIGSQGFEAKMRLVMELRADPERHHIRHLCLVKGNYLPAEYKHDSFELNFSEGLNFSSTGERVPFALLKDGQDNTSDDSFNERIEQMRKLRDEGKTLREIGQQFGISPATVMRQLDKI